MRNDRAPTAGTVNFCDEHGQHEGEVCIQCYAIQQERVERESLPLRLQNTTEHLRRWVIEQNALRNGHA